MRIWVTGLPGCGKTTFMDLLRKKLKVPYLGFLTREIRINNQRQGFRLIDLKTGKEFEFASTKRISNLKFAQYWLNLHYLEKLIDQFKQELIQHRCLVLIDEIGKMEFKSVKFREFVKFLIKHDYDLIATLHRCLVKKFEHLGKLIWLKKGEAQKLASGLALKINKEKFLN